MIVRTLWEKIAEGRSEMRRDGVVEKIWELMGRRDWGITGKKRDVREIWRNGGRKSENGR